MRHGFFAGHEIPRIFFCTVCCWASVEEKQSAKGSEPDAGRTGTRSVLPTEFSISMASMQMLWPQVPGDPWPSAL